MRKWCSSLRLRHYYVACLSYHSTGAVRVFIFDHTIRREARDQRQGEAKVQLRGPVRRVHIDQSYAASIERVSHHLPDEAEQLLKKRFQIINVIQARLHQCTRG